MKEIKLGTFYGEDIVIKATQNENEDWNKLWEDWLATEKRKAGIEYQDELFFKEADIKAKKKFWLVNLFDKI